MEVASRPEKQALVASFERRETADTWETYAKAPPHSLRESSPSWLRRVGVSASLLIIPIAYSALVVIIGCLHRKKQNSFGDTVLEILQVASTLWPILFAAIMGPLLKTLALLAAERGTKLASLEFLLTSQTIATALKNLVTIGGIRKWTIFIVAVWFLSPLGGQAALRSLHLQPNPISIQTPAIYYLGINRSEIRDYYRAGAEVFSGASIEASLISDLRTVVAASFSTPDILVSHANGSSPRFDNATKILGGRWEASRLGHRDLWRNVRIPFLELLSGYDSDKPTSWVSVPSDEVVPYASLIGLPIRGGSFDRAGNSTMTVKFHYHTLSCGNDFNGTSWVYNGSEALYLHNTSSSVLLRYQNINAVSESLGYPNIWLDLVNNSAVIEHLTTDGQVEPQSKLQLVFGGSCSNPSSGKTVEMLRVCDIGLSYVEMEVRCTRTTAVADLVCEANRIRHAPSYPIEGNLTALSAWRMSTGILGELPFTGASQHLSEPSVLEMYLRDPPRTFQRLRTYGGSNFDYRDESGCYSLLPANVIERRLATAINTVTMASYNSSILTGGDGVALENRGLPWQNTTATWTEFEENIYVLNKPWFCITVISTAVLLICAIANAIIRHLIRAPDFMSSVAGLTRDSSFVNVSQDGSGMSGVDRLETLKDVQVRICDVYPGQDVGRIAFTTETGSPRLDRKRRYH
ncbi:hypothetical protein FSARC_672 [Fusarium sarcochroum]|uniref:Transmembrane protein n=1 Tax=Fusarium sarcochroum TaxID=1208366 RepID=A0A8H4UAG8_9HYPO|nr:hypothetical protein FSARC_672 [Fusarium sarcochroum]